MEPSKFPLFKPQFKLNMVCNELPVSPFDDVSGTRWRRMIILPFTPPRIVERIELSKSKNKLEVVSIQEDKIQSDKNHM